jgi:hypothetical protein
LLLALSYKLTKEENRKASQDDLALAPT